MHAATIFFAISRSEYSEPIVCKISSHTDTMKMNMKDDDFNMLSSSRGYVNWVFKKKYLNHLGDVVLTMYHIE